MEKEKIIIKFILQYYRWQCSWAQLVDAIIGILTFGFIRTSLHLEAVKIAAKKRWSYK